MNKKPLVQVDRRFLQFFHRIKSYYTLKKHCLYSQGYVCCIKYCQAKTIKREISNKPQYYGNNVFVTRDCNITRLICQRFVIATHIATKKGIAPPEQYGHNSKIKEIKLPPQIRPYYGRKQFAQIFNYTPIVLIEQYLYDAYVLENNILRKQSRGTGYSFQG